MRLGRRGRLGSHLDLRLNEVAALFCSCFFENLLNPPQLPPQPAVLF